MDLPQVRITFERSLTQADEWVVTRREEIYDAVNRTMVEGDTVTFRVTGSDARVWAAAIANILHHMNAREDARTRTKR